MTEKPFAGVLKSSQVRDYIQGLALNLKPGARIPSEHELVELCRVSRGTVGRALAELVSQGLLHRIQGKGTFVAASAGEGSRSETRACGRVLLARGWVQDGYHPYYSERLRGIADVLGEAGYALEVVDAREGFYERLSARALDDDVQGMISFHVGEQDLPRLRRDFAKPVVTTYETEVPGASEVSVILETGPAIRQLASRFASCGHRRLLLMTNKDEHLRAFREELPEDADISVCHYCSSEEGGHEAMKQGWAFSPSGVFVDDDVVARGVISFLLGRGSRIPDHVSLAATANRGVVLRAPEPVSTIEIDAYKLGSCAAQTMIGLLRGESPPGKPVRLLAPFIDRGSIKPVVEPVPRV